jgi:hypothetical protein
VIEVGFGKRERFWMRSPARQRITISAAVGAVTGRTHHGDDLFNLGRIGGIPQSLVAWRSTSVESRRQAPLALRAHSA